MMPRFVSILTAMAWLFILFVSSADVPPNRIVAFDSPMAVISDVFLLGLIAIIAASIYFAFRPRRWLALTLLLVSLVMACFCAYTLWTHISFFAIFGAGYLHCLQVYSRDPTFLTGLIFISLPFMWAAIFWRLMRIRDEGLTKR